MTLEEAEKIAEVAEQADNGCPFCVEAMAEILQETFPEFKWEFVAKGPFTYQRIKVSPCA